MALFDKKRQEQKEKEDQKLRDWIAQNLRSSASWGVFTQGTRWICPLCASVAVEVEDEDALLDAIWKHLHERCTPFQAGIREPRKDLPTLEAIARRIEIKAEILSSSAWHQRDSRGRWYCPYCLKDTEVTIPKDGSINADLMTAISDHVERCFAYDHGIGRIHDVAEVQRVIQDFESRTKMSAAIKQRLQTNPVWQVRSPKGRWVCPYCRQETGIDASTDFLLQSATGLVAQHLLGHCGPYREKKEPAGTPEELKALHKAAPPPTAATQTPTTDGKAIADEVMQRMRQEIQEMKGAESAEHTEMRRGLETAGKRQKQMLAEAPKIPGFDFHVLFKPCSVVAGDFYDFPRIGPEEVGILIGDVSGHGIEAGIVMSLMKKVISIHARGSSSAKQTLVTANVDIYPDLDRNVFATVCYCVLNTQTRELRIARAGHNPVMIFNPDKGGEPVCLEPQGMALGMDRGPRFESVLEEVTVQLERGDTVLLFTDGLNEQHGTDGSEFGLEKVLKCLQEHSGYDAKYLLRMTEMELADWRGGPQKELEDDVTMIGIKVK
jgi:serine phosphatase RsbU (regulator of sigma subunit)